MALTSNTLLAETNVLAVLDITPIAEIMIHYKQQQPSSSHESGFTIVESLVAILVAASLLSAIAPVIVLSVATRVQAKRIETAANAAKSYIDGIKSGTITPQPPITMGSSDYTVPDPPPPDAPSGTLTCPTTGSGICSISPSTTSFQLYCVDGDTGGCTNNNSNDMIIQAFGYNRISSDAQSGYKLGLRVYRADAFQAGITLKALKDDVKQQQTFTGGTGFTPIQAPLVEITTEISNTSTNFNNFCQRLKDPTKNTSTNTACN